MVTENKHMVDCVRNAASRLNELLVQAKDAGLKIDVIDVRPHQRINPYLMVDVIETNWKP